MLGAKDFEYIFAPADRHINARTLLACFQLPSVESLSDQNVPNSNHRRSKRQDMQEAFLKRSSIKRAAQLRKRAQGIAMSFSPLCFFFLSFFQQELC